MLAKVILVEYMVIMLVFIVECNDMNNRIARNNRFSDVWDNSLHRDNGTRNEAGRGFFFAGGLLSLGKVLNFFPVGGERECQPAGYNVAKAGICLNQYDCRQRDGRAAGDCAQGLGVCCVFEVSCGGIVQNNLTYFMSPNFPELWSGDQDCAVTIEKTHAGITQLRIDFVHFTIGQPNRTTGECDEDAMVLGDGDTKFVLCGQNHGQHIYYSLGSGSERREAGELAGAVATRLVMRMRGADMPRLWLLRLAQLPLAYTAPHDCLQYYTEVNGTIRTFNYASNGRHLASQQYRACVRRLAGHCAVRYAPCDARSFRVGPATSQQITDPAETMMPANMPAQDDEIEGSGADPQVASPAPAQPGMMARRARAWSPYAQHFADEQLRYAGYGRPLLGLRAHGRLRCADRVTIPCDHEYFVSSSFTGAGVCDPHHCGNSFCPGTPFPQCQLETSISPFAVSVHFGPPTPKENPEDNIGMCLRYTQLPCNV